ncbi:hypothetical protein AB9M62_25330 [Bacillales bacterium AN1005]
MEKILEKEEFCTNVSRLYSCYEYIEKYKQEIAKYASKIEHYVKDNEKVQGYIAEIKAKSALSKLFNGTKHMEDIATLKSIIKRNDESIDNSSYFVDYNQNALNKEIEELNEHNSKSPIPEQYLNERCIRIFHSYIDDDRTFEQDETIALFEKEYGSHS